MQVSFLPARPAAWSVTELTRYVRDLLASDSNLQDVWVQGEISNFSRPASGHWYFTVKDSGAALKCVMWRTIAGRQTFLPRDGDAIQAHGALSVYEAGGVYQLYVDALRPAGEGALYQEFLRLKARLEAEGLFDPARKRPLPRWPHRIGIVTSPSGAALRDMLNTLRRRYPFVEVVLASTPVQGDEAAPGIVSGLQRLAEFAHPDVILVARGGGSIEDLWAFNHESVARAIAACPVPVITGVGHETDFTIADFVADLRAPTPTAAAELATPDREDLITALAEMYGRLGRAAETMLTNQRWSLSDLQNRLRLHSPQAFLRSERQSLDELERRAASHLAHRMQLQRATLFGLRQRLNALNPRAVLRRGFALVTGPDGSLVYHVDQAHPGDALAIQLADGTISAKALTIQKG